MNEVVWQERTVHHHQQVHPHHQTHHSVMLANGQLPQSAEMINKNAHNNNQNHNQNSVRSQDDAMVGYFFQRPNDPDFQNYAKQARWALVDDTNIEVIHLLPHKFCDFHYHINAVNFAIV